MLYDGYPRQSRPDLFKNCKWTLRVQAFKDSFATIACIVSCLSYRDRQAHRIVFKPMPEFDKVVAKTSRSPLQCQPLREQNRSGDLGRPVLIFKHACSPLRLHACRSSFTTVSIMLQPDHKRYANPGLHYYGWSCYLLIVVSPAVHVSQCWREWWKMHSQEDHAYLSLL